MCMPSKLPIVATQPRGRSVCRSGSLMRIMGEDRGRERTARGSSHTRHKLVRLKALLASHRSRRRIGCRCRASVASAREGLQVGEVVRCLAGFGCVGSALRLRFPQDRSLHERLVALRPLLGWRRARSVDRCSAAAARRNGRSGDQTHIRIAYACEAGQAMRARAVRR